MRQPLQSTEIRLLRADDVEPIAAAFRQLGWESNKPLSQYKRYLAEQETGDRTVFVSFDGEGFAGYLTIVWGPEYQPFLEQRIPEITDFNVLPRSRRKGIGSALMDHAEAAIASRSPIAGIGVGMTADYGPAQRLYVLRGYIPDGNGLAYRGQVAQYGTQVTVDDDLALYFTKRVSRP